MEESASGMERALFSLLLCRSDVEKDAVWSRPHRRITQRTLGEVFRTSLPFFFFFRVDDLYLFKTSQVIKSEYCGQKL